MIKQQNGGAEFAGIETADLQRAVQLLISPDWLREREALIALLVAFDFNAEDVTEVLATGKPLNDGPLLKL